MDDLQFRLTVLQQKKAAWKKELNLRLLDEYLDKVVQSMWGIHNSTMTRLVD